MIGTLAMALLLAKVHGCRSGAWPPRTCEHWATQGDGLIIIDLALRRTLGVLVDRFEKSAHFRAGDVAVFNLCRVVGRCVGRPFIEGVDKRVACCATIESLL